MASPVPRIINKACHRRAKIAGVIYSGYAAPQFESLVPRSYLQDGTCWCLRLKDKPVHWLAVRVGIDLNEDRRFHRRSLRILS